MTSSMFRTVRSTGGNKVDARDQEMIDEAMARRAKITHPIEGDVVIFSDLVKRRISYENNFMNSVQTSDGGSFHLHSSGTMSFSGGLYGSIPVAVLTDTGRTEPAWAWIFHHGVGKAHNGVDFVVPVRVWKASIPANERSILA